MCDISLRAGSDCGSRWTGAMSTWQRRLKVPNQGPFVRASCVSEKGTGMRLNKLLTVVLGLALALADLPARPAGAATATTTFLVTANVSVSCLIAATDLDFGDYISGQLDGQSQITVTCTNTATWNVGLNAGTCSGATVTTRCMKGPGTAILNYSLSSDTTRVVNWGNTVGTDTVSGTGTGGPQIITVYGRIPAGQTTTVPGGYTDTITATITF
jgi:spore coat protein U-like protein